MWTIVVWNASTQLLKAALSLRVDGVDSLKGVPAASTLAAANSLGTSRGVHNCRRFFIEEVGMTHSLKQIDRIAIDPMAPSSYAIQAIIDGLDQVAVEMERKWGIGRLRLLVSDFLRAKFDSQRDKLAAAIATNREVYIRAQAEGMKRAWAALDNAADGS